MLGCLGGDGGGGGVRSSSGAGEGRRACADDNFKTAEQGPPGVPWEIGLGGGFKCLTAIGIQIESC